jgi:hypothetical protein
LKQLAEGLKAITLVNSPAGRDQAHALAMTARGARTAIEKAVGVNCPVCGGLSAPNISKFKVAVQAKYESTGNLVKDIAKLKRKR